MHLSPLLGIIRLGSSHNHPISFPPSLGFIPRVKRIPISKKFFPDHFESSLKQYLSTSADMLPQSCPIVLLADQSFENSLSQAGKRLHKLFPDRDIWISKRGEEERGCTSCVAPCIPDHVGTVVSSDSKEASPVSKEEKKEAETKKDETKKDLTSISVDVGEVEIQNEEEEGEKEKESEDEDPEMKKQTAAEVFALEDSSFESYKAPEGSYFKHFSCGTFLPDFLSTLSGCLVIHLSDCESREEEESLSSAYSCCSDLFKMTGLSYSLTDIIINCDISHLLTYKFISFNSHAGSLSALWQLYENPKELIGYCTMTGMKKRMKYIEMFREKFDELRSVAGIPSPSNPIASVGLLIDILSPEPRHLQAMISLSAFIKHSYGVNCYIFNVGREMREDKLLNSPLISCWIVLSECIHKASILHDSIPPKMRDDGYKDIQSNMPDTPIIDLSEFLQMIGGIIGTQDGQEYDCDTCDMHGSSAMDKELSMWDGKVNSWNVIERTLALSGAASASLTDVRRSESLDIDGDLQKEWKVEHIPVLESPKFVKQGDCGIAEGYAKETKEEQKIE
ncbi:hypothetical protein ADUPG1_009524 [Aduncisulcus paluster]|uniref:Uncharacterized protein n=1 Tax=Aduncisulcus paluster TaxID=2918883 RepID=A0ABQ5KVV8_9EUKA|nr:hypothetical protein ADUPG1_009524 [Aduncisulcus paluster]